MISPDALNAWRTDHPWADDDQVEQDLIMTRVAVEVASQPSYATDSYGVVVPASTSSSSR